MKPGKHPVTFHVTGGTQVTVDLTAEEVGNIMDQIDNEGHFGSFNSDNGTQVWIPTRHITLVKYPSDGPSPWGNP
jgi:hypothetical protein